MADIKDRDLVRLYWPVELRPAFDALLGIEDALADVVATSTQPTLGAIRLAWWREALERLDHQPPPPEPRLQAAAAELLPHGISGEQLAGLEAGWAALLEEEPDAVAVQGRGVLLFRFGANLLDVPFDDRLGAAGRSFALADVARRGLLDIGAIRPTALNGTVEWRARPLTALAALAVRDLRRGRPFEPEATPGRAWALLLHRFSGRIA